MNRTGVNLQELLGAYRQGALTPHYLPSHAQVVRDIVLITNVDDIRTVEPDSMLLLGDELSLGGWIVSVALRYAWERHAVAVVVADASFSDTVVELARRFGVALLTTSRGIDQTALALAREFGALDAGVLRRLDTLHLRLAACTSIESALSELSRDLSGAFVSVTVMQLSLVEVGIAAPDAVELRVSLGDEQHDLVARVSRAQQEFASLAMARARAIIRSVLLAQELDDILSAAPLLSFAMLTGKHARSQSGTLELSAKPPRWWRPGAPVLAVVILASGGEDLATRTAPLVHARWRRAFPQAPLVRMSSGWFALLPLSSSYEAAETAISHLARVELGALGLAVGVSRDHEDDPDGDDRLKDLLRRAQLAARFADPRDGVVDFASMDEPLLRKLLHPTDASDLVDLIFPRLLVDPHAIELIRTIIAYLDCAGSMTAAAAVLGVHRNTIQLRLRHGAELGVQLDDPDRVLSTHLMLSALDLTALTSRSPSP